MRARKVEGQANQWVFYVEQPQVVADEEGESTVIMVEQIVEVVAFATDTVLNDEAAAIREFNTNIAPLIADKFMTDEILEQEYSQRVSQHIDNVARERNFDDARDAVSYLNDPNPMYAAEAAAVLNWRSAIWTDYEKRLKKGVKVFGSWEKLLASLPQIEWPK